jgi:hypothetical protein
LKSRLTKHLSEAEQFEIVKFFEECLEFTSTCVFVNMMLDKKGDSFRVDSYALKSFLKEEYPTAYARYLMNKNKSPENNIQKAREKRAQDWIDAFSSDQKQDPHEFHDDYDDPPAFNKRKKFGPRNDPRGYD